MNPSKSNISLERQLEMIRLAALTSPGETSTALRSAVEADAALRDGGRREAPVEEIPQELTGFLTKVSANAAGITTEDLAALQTAGYSEDAIFEISVSAALGAAFARLERTLELLDGGDS